MGEAAWHGIQRSWWACLSKVVAVLDEGVPSLLPALLIADPTGMSGRPQKLGSGRQTGTVELDRPVR
jgi:hypothetical protein